MCASIAFPDYKLMSERYMIDRSLTLSYFPQFIEEGTVQNLWRTIPLSLRIRLPIESPFA